MSTLSILLWVAGPFLESLVLMRAVRGGYLQRYRVFYAYVSWVLVCDLSLLLIYKTLPGQYAYFYWSSELFSVAMGCGVVWEIYSVALAHYPGAARMARNVLLFLFVVTFSRVMVFAANEGRWLPGATTLETEREFRIVQFAMLAGLTFLLMHYAVPLGRNLKGIIAGYGLFLASSLVQLTLRQGMGERFQTWWQYIQPASYFLILAIWCASLWSYGPNPNPARKARLELDYDSLTNRTRTRIESARRLLARSLRS
jgi:hypothetical protein